MTIRTIELPTPPTANHAYIDFVLPAKPGKKARAMRMLTNDGKAYIEDVRNRLRLAGWQATAEEVKLTIWWRRERRAGDLSNRIKVLEDALKGHAYVDDGQVIELHAIRSDDKVRAGVTVRVEIMAALTDEARQEALTLEFSTVSTAGPVCAAIPARGSDSLAAAESWLSSPDAATA